MKKIKVFQSVLDNNYIIRYNDSIKIFFSIKFVIFQKNYIKKYNI
jgi:hypothetical protein